MFALTDHVTNNLHDASYKPKRDYRNYLNLASNELNHPALQELLKKYHSQYLPKNTAMYPYYDEVRAELVAFLGLEPGSMLLSPGSDSAIAMLLSHFAKKNNSLILQAPNYYNYLYYAKLNGLNVTEINFVGKSHTQFVDEFCQVLQTKPPSLVALTNPDPYVGGLLTLKEIEVILAKCYRCNHLLIIDETYSKFSGLSHFSLLNKYDNVIILHTLSKAYGAAGVRLAYILSSPKIIRVVFKTGIEYGVNLYALAYLKFIMDHHLEFDALIKEIIANRNYCIDACNEKMKAWSLLPSSSIFVTLDVFSPSTAEFIVQALEQKEIIIRNLHQFDEQLRGKIRMCMSGKTTLDQLLTELFQIYDAIESNSLI